MYNYNIYNLLFYFVAHKLYSVSPGTRPQIEHNNLYYIVASEASFLVCTMAMIFTRYILLFFQAVRHFVNVLNVSPCI